MDTDFRFFPKLTPELRQMIWESALKGTWSVSKFSRLGRHIRMSGNLHRAIGQVCLEARSVMQRLCTNIDPFGWIDFNQHLFIFRDTRFDRKLMEQLDSQTSLYEHIRHILINPRDWSECFATLRFIRECCLSLKSLVITAPWIDPADVADTIEALDIAPYEDWTPLPDLSPTEIKFETLLDDLDLGLAGNHIRDAQYQTRLDHAVIRCRQDMDEIEQPYKRTRLAMRKVDLLVQAFPSEKPHVYFRRREQITIGSEG